VITFFQSDRARSRVSSIDEVRSNQLRNFTMSSIVAGVSTHDFSMAKGRRNGRNNDLNAAFIFFIGLALSHLSIVVTPSVS
jgi:hypothetical protein